MFLSGVRSVLRAAGIFLVSFLATYTVGWCVIVFPRLTWHQWMSEKHVPLEFFLINDETSGTLAILGIIIACISVKRYGSGHASR